MSRHSVWWIDDNPQREKNSADVLEQQLESISVEFSMPEDASQDLRQGTNPEVDLVLIDWMLHEKGDFLGKGLTMAGTVRENLPGVPIYAFTGGSLSELETPVSQEHFQATFPVKDLISRNGAVKLKADLEDYASLDAVRGDGFNALLRTLNPPEDAVQELEGIIPREFNSGLKDDPTIDGGSIIEFSDWVRHRFLTTPGPLWNKIWTATKLGIEAPALEQYEEKLYQTQQGDFTYGGLFSHRKETRWWSSELIAAIVELNEEREKPVGEIVRTAPHLLAVNETEIAECRVCGDEFPETVAAGQQGNNAEYPVHFRCSDVHHSREGKFEDYRVADDLVE